MSTIKTDNIEALISSDRVKIPKLMTTADQIDLTAPNGDIKTVQDLSSSDEGNGAKLIGIPSSAGFTSDNLLDALTETFDAVSGKVDLSTLTTSSGTTIIGHQKSSGLAIRILSEILNEEVRLSDYLNTDDTNVKSDPTKDQSSGLNAAMIAASALSATTGATVRLKFPANSIIRARNIDLRPGVIIDLNGSMLKTIDSVTTASGFRLLRLFDTLFNAPSGLEQLPIGVINGVLDGNLSGLGPWANTVVRTRMSNQGSGYTSIPTASISTTGAGTGTSLLVYMGIENATLTSGGSGYVVNDEIILGSGTGTFYNTTNPRVIVDAVDGSGTVTQWHLIERGAFVTLPTGAISQSSLASFQTRATKTGGTGFQITPTTYVVAHTRVNVNGSGYL